mgnify:CR=1 FL=1
MAKQKKSKMALYTRQDKIILYCGYALLGLFLLAIIVPMIYIVIASFMDPVTLQNKGISFDFSKWSLDAYQRVVSDKQIWVGFRNAVLYSIIFTIISVAVTMLAAYPMSLPDFKGKKIFNTLFVITMFFSGGMIPMYLTVQQLHIYNTTWAMVLPVAVSAYNLIVCRSFFESGIPVELLEAAKIDGCSDFGFFFKIAIPLSKTIIAVMCLFYATAMWNQFFNALMFLQDDSKMPLQVVLRNLVLMNQSNQMGSSASEMVTKQKLAEQLKYCVVVVSAFPLLCVYPFLQKYFAKGVTIGAVKG